jgi:hypothetical protein
MTSPFPNISEFRISITDPENQSIETFGGARDITNYEYEVKKNDEKRKILVLKKEYLGVFIDDLKNIMKYDQSSQFVDEKTKRV